MTAGGNHDFFSAVAAFVLAVNNCHGAATINPCSAFKPGDFVFLKQKINTRR